MSLHRPYLLAHLVLITVLIVALALICKFARQPSNTSTFTLRVPISGTEFLAEISPDGSKAGILSVGGTLVDLVARELTPSNPTIISANPIAGFAYLSHPNGDFYTNTGANRVCPFVDAPSTCDTAQLLPIFYGSPNANGPSRYVVRLGSAVGVAFGTQAPIDTGIALTLTASVGESSIAVPNTSNFTLPLFFRSPQDPAEVKSATYDASDLFLGFLRYSLTPEAPLAPNSPDRYSVINPFSVPPLARLLRLEKSSVSIAVDLEWSALGDMNNQIDIGPGFFRQAVWYESLQLLGVLYLVQDAPGTGPKQWLVNFYEPNNNTAKYKRLPVRGSPDTQQDLHSAAQYPPTLLSTTAPPRAIFVANKVTGQGFLPIYVTRFDVS